MAVAHCHVRLAQSHSELASDMRLFDEFVITVSESALNAEFAGLVVLPELANLGLLLLFISGL